MLDQIQYDKTIRDMKTPRTKRKLISSSTQVLTKQPNYNQKLNKATKKAWKTKNLQFN